MDHGSNSTTESSKKSSQPKLTKRRRKFSERQTLLSEQWVQAHDGGDVDKAVEIFDEVLREKVVFVADGSGRLLQLISSRTDKDNVENMVKLVDRVVVSTEAAGGKLKENQLTVMLRVFCIAKNADRATETLCRILDMEKEAKGQSPLSASPGVEKVKARTAAKLRSFSPVLSLLVSLSRWRDVLRLYKRMIAVQINPCQHEFSLVLQAIINIEADAEAHNAADNDVLPTWQEVLRHIAKQMTTIFDMDLQIALQQLFTNHLAGWQMQSCDIPSSGVCPVTGTQLQSGALPLAELQRLMQLSENLITQNTPSSRSAAVAKWFGALKDDLNNKPPFDVIIDGANIGHFKQNRPHGMFSYYQVDSVVKHFLAQGKQVLLVLHSKWLTPSASQILVSKKRALEPPTTGAEAVVVSEDNHHIATDEPPAKRHHKDTQPTQNSTSDENQPQIPPPQPEAEQAIQKQHEVEECVEQILEQARSIIQSWRAHPRLLLEVPARTNDDWYWLFAALHSCAKKLQQTPTTTTTEAQATPNHNLCVVTNDQMRDHHFGMVAPRSFTLWRDTHVMRYDMQVKGRVADLPDVTPRCEFSFSFVDPHPFASVCVESKNGNAWHFPFVQDDIPVVPDEDLAPPLETVNWVVAFKKD